MRLQLTQFNGGLYESFRFEPGVGSAAFAGMRGHTFPVIVLTGSCWNERTKKFGRFRGTALVIRIGCEIIA